jgi:putative transposase
VLLRREGWSAGKNLVYRLYTEEGLQLRSKRPRHRKMAVGRRERYEPKRPNQAWSMDFVADQLVNGLRLRAARRKLTLRLVRERQVDHAGS